MRRRFPAAASAALLLTAVSLFSCFSDSVDEPGLWPEIEPYASDFLKVSDLHSIHYRLCGNPDGVPVFVLHGGPGAGCFPYYRRFFNPEKYMIVLHDQRGCGRSTPSFEIRENTTWDLVEDIEKLRRHVGVDRIILFGGSWGTTLALAYAEKYPENVLAMVLRGVFLSTEEEMQHYYYGGTRSFFPEVYDRLAGVMEEAGTTLSPQNLFRLINEGEEEQIRKFCVAWVEYESGISRLVPGGDDINAGWDNSDVYRHVIRSMGLLENYYMANNCFLENGQLLRDATKIAHIPAVIINGRYDTVCPPVNAYMLHKALPASELIITESAGHSMDEPGIELQLIKTMIEMEGRF